jgi:CDP-glucose 4,6-dehydratase
VLGGGDWSPDRIVPDIVRAIRAGTALRLRMPTATRPWQHVLDLCHAYLLLGRALFERRAGSHSEEIETGQAWNFGPAHGSETTVAELVVRFLQSWGEPDYPVEYVAPPHHESATLRLDASRARKHLGWRPVLDSAATIDWTADWYRRYLKGVQSARRLVEEQIDRFEDMLSEQGAGERSQPEHAATDVGR